jgi:hypothetical protein
VALDIKWGERAVFAIARMTPGGGERERAVKAADGVGLNTIIHRGRISITKIYRSKLYRRFMLPDCHAIAIFFCEMTCLYAVIFESNISQQYGLSKQKL